MPAPRFLRNVLATFPLLEYDEQVVETLGDSEYPAYPSAPTLWTYGPGINEERESFDLACLKAQAEAAFRGLQLQTRCLQVAEGAPGGELPALHLPNGDLIAAAGISAWTEKNGPNASSSGNNAKDIKEGYALSDEEKTQRENTILQSRTYCNLIQSKLQPALLAHLFLNPTVFSSLTTTLYHPQTIPFSTPKAAVAPILTRYAHGALAKARKLEVQAEIQKLLNQKPGWRTQIDLEQIQQGGEETMDLLAEKLANQGTGWFFGSENATPLDAVLYAHLHLIHRLHAPQLGAPSPLRRKLEKHPNLLQWAKRLHQEYFTA